MNRKNRIARSLISSFYFAEWEERVSEIYRLFRLTEHIDYTVKYLGTGGRSYEENVCTKDLFGVTKVSYVA